MMFGGHEVYVGSKEIVWALPILSMHTFQRACQAHIWALRILSMHEVYVGSERD